MAARLSSYLLALIFAASGGAKLAALPFEVEAFARWGYPPAFMLVTGVLEIAGAIATHLVHGEWAMAVIATAIASLAAWRGWSGRGSLRGLLPCPGHRD